MNLNKKHLFSFLLVFTLIVCIFAVSAFAEGENIEVEISDDSFSVLNGESTDVFSGTDALDDFSEYIADNLNDNQNIIVSDFSDWSVYTGGDISDGKYYLENDVDTNDTINVTGTAYIDLNGKVLRILSNSSVIAVGENAVLNIFDSDPSSVHVIDEYRYIDDRDGSHPTGETVEVSGGIITGGARGILVEGTLNMFGGSVAGNHNTSQSGAGVYVDGGEFNLYDGSLTYNSGRQGAVSISNAGTFSMYGGSIDHNDGGRGANAVTVGYDDIKATGSSFVMNGGVIELNNADLNINDINPIIELRGRDSFIMNGGTIKNNECGIVVSPSIEESEIIIAGGNIVNNTIINTGEISSSAINNFAARTVLGGDANISGNVSDSGSECNVFIINKVKLDGELYDVSEVFGFETSKIEAGNLGDNAKIGLSFANIIFEMYQPDPDDYPDYFEPRFVGLEGVSGAAIFPLAGITFTSDDASRFYDDFGKYGTLKESDGNIWLSDAVDPDPSPVPGPDPTPVIPENIPDPVEPVVLDTEPDDAEPEVLVNEVDNIEDEKVALAENPVIEPSAASTWSLVNVVLAVLSLAGTLTAIIGKKENPGKIAGSVSTVGAAITLALTSNFAGSMVMTDKATVLMAVFAAVSAAVLIIKDKKEA